ncbi:Velvet domain-containing protein [Pleurotus pulmonarius]
MSGTPISAEKQNLTSIYYTTVFARMELDTTPCPSCINNASPSAIFHQNSSQRRFDNSLMSVATLFAGVCRPLSSSPQEAERALLSRGSLHPEPEYPSKLTSSRSLASSCRGNAKHHLRPTCIQSDPQLTSQPVLSTKTRTPSLQSSPSLSQHSVSNSGDSSPQTPATSLYFSSTGTRSSRSTPSSRDSYSSVSPPPSHYFRRHPLIQVSSLLADSNTWSYRLEVVQHPQKTADFGSASLSRLPLTPPIVVQLIVKDPSGNSIIPEVELPFLIAHLSLFSADGQRQLDMGSAPGGDLSPPILYGNLVSSVHQLEDLQGNMGMFFLFPDVSIRYRGQFRLRVNLMRLMDQTGRMSITPEGSVLAYATTGPFDVVAYNEYSAVPPTRLTQWLLRQGARLSTHMSNPNP